MVPQKKNAIELPNILGGIISSGICDIYIFFFLEYGMRASSFIDNTNLIWRVYMYNVLRWFQ